MIALWLALSLSLTACSPAWWQGLKENPVQSTEVILGTVANIERVATLAFSQLKPLLPADKQESYQAKFDDAVLVLAKAVQAVRSAVRAAANAQEEKPDLSKVIADVTKAVTDIQALIAEVKGIVAPLRSTAAGSTPAKGIMTASSLATLVEDFNAQMK